MARLIDVSIAGVSVELPAPPDVPTGGRLELVWAGAVTEVNIAHGHLDADSGLLGMGLVVKGMDDAFRERLHKAVSAGRGARGVEKAWDQAR